MTNFNFSFLFLLASLISSSCNVISMVTGDKTNLKVNQNKNDGDSPSEEISNACDVASGCSHWFNAEDFDSFFSDGACATAISNDGDLVRCWSSQTSAAAITRSAGNTGTYLSSGVSGRPGFSIDGNTSSAYQSTGLFPQFNQTWIFVGRITAAPPAQRFIFGNGDSASTNIMGVSVDASLGIAAQYGSSPVATASGAVAVNTPFLITIVADGSMFEFFFNGSSVGSDVISTLSSANDIYLAGHNYGTVSNGADLVAAELVVYDYALTETERLNVENYLRGKYGI